MYINIYYMGGKLYMLEPINFLFFFLPLAIIFVLFILIVNINKEKQPFGYTIKVPLSEEQFSELSSHYYKKVLILSLPITIIVPIISIFINSFIVGATLLTISILTMTILNTIFYIQNYQKIKALESETQNNIK